MGSYAKTQTELASQLGVSQATVSRWLRKGVGPGAGAKGYDVAAWVEVVRLRQEGGGEPPADSQPTSRADPDAELSPQEERACVVLEAHDSTPMQIAGAALALASAEMSWAKRQGKRLRREHFAAMKQALEEARRTETAAIEQAKESGLLVTRSDLERVVGHLARLLLQGLEQWSSDVASRVQLWVASEDFAAKSADAQRAEVQAWALQSQRELREAAVSDLTSVLAEVGGGE